MPGQQPGVGDVGRPVVLLGRPREDERPPRLLGDGAVGGERDAHVHGVAQRVADDGVRPVHRPAEAVLVGRGEEEVLLVVVEVLVVQARLALAERRLRRVLRVGLERAEVVLESGHQGNVLH